MYFMSSFYSSLILTIALYLVLLHNYTQAQTISSSVHCNPHKNLCVACPHLSTNAKTHAFNKYTQISSKKQFYVLGTLNHFIMKNQCSDMLQIFEKGEKGEWELPNSIKKDIQDKNSFIKGSLEVNLARGVQHHLTITQTADFVIIYEGLEPIYPLISNQREQNPERLMKLSRSLNWGMLFALILTYLDSKLGIFSDKRSYPLPLIQLTILSLVIYISYEVNTFVNLFFPQIMCLVYVLSNIHNRFDEHQKATLMIGLFSVLLLCFVNEQMTILADIFCLIAIKNKFPRRRQTSPRIKTSAALILICLITNTVRVIGSLNVLTYSAYTAKIIFIPFSILLFQSNHALQKAQNQLNKTARKYYGQH